jgi:hypothetical protein
MIASEAREISADPPRILYHYTTQDGLLGILLGHTIWATHSQYLNDKSEYLYALNLIREGAKERRLVADEAERGALDLIIDRARDYLASINVCVCSFSSVHDSLSQWRAYGGSTSSYAIGFDRKFLSDVANRKSSILSDASTGTTNSSISSKSS